MPATVEAPIAAQKEETPADETILVKCPSCKGELALKRENLGTEGNCIYCDDRIVAAASGGDGEVRVFVLSEPASIFEPASKSDAPALEEPANEEPAARATPDFSGTPQRGPMESPVTNPVSESEPVAAPASAMDMASKFGLPVTADAEISHNDEVSKPEEPEPPVDEPAAAPANAMDMASKFGLPATADAEVGSTEELSKPVEPELPVDQPGVAPSASAWGAPMTSVAEVPEKEPELPGAEAFAAPTETSSATSTDPAEVSGDEAAANSFFGMSKEPAATPEAVTPLESTPAMPSEVIPEKPEAASSSEQEPETEVTSFGAAAPWGKPTDLASPEAKEESEPSIDAPPPQPQFSGFAPPTQSPDPSALDSLQELATAQPETAAEEPAVSSFADLSPEPSSFLGNNADSSGDSSAPVSSPEAPVQKVDEVTIPTAWGPPPGGETVDAASGGEETPVADQPTSLFDPVEPGSGAEESTPSPSSLFEGSPTSEGTEEGAGLFSDLMKNQPQASSTPSAASFASPFESLQEAEPESTAPSSSPLLDSMSDSSAPENPNTGGATDLGQDSLGSPESSPPPMAAHSSMPNVTPFQKPKKKVSKTFISVMVVILGIVCGAGLATFIVPVDEYVAKARDMIHGKIGDTVVTPVTTPAPPPSQPQPLEVPEAVVTEAIAP
ncbi:MAG: hypothetical protein AAF236_00050 [Verrucomicrobiota bacterium]